MAGNSSAAATSGAITGKNAVENNAVSGIDGFGSGFWDNKQAQ
ncbi:MULTISPECIES: VENN motif pre-toxin domain-containing protein [unclassified Pantoea]|nr:MULTISPECIES: VENN motif pre-toxin domain-containing protein [unclassified Pantoea]